MGTVVSRALDELVPGGARPGELDRGGRSLRLVAMGSGPVSLVFEAGSSDTSLSWAPILPPLSARARLVAYDRAGLGVSDPGPVSMSRQVADLAAVVASVERPVVLVAHSWGGLLAQALILRRPEIADGLVLVDTAMERMTDDLPGWLVRMATSVARYGPTALDAAGLLAPLQRRRARALARMLDAGPAVRRRFVREYVEARPVPGVRAESRAIRRCLPYLTESRRRPFPSLPTAVLSAERGVPRRLRRRWTEEQAALAGAVPTAVHRVVAGAGHQIHWDRPDAVLEAIAEVVGRATGGGGGR